MKLENKRSLAARTLNVGKGRIVFNAERLSEIKEAITKQDIKDLKEAGSIKIKHKSGRKTTKKRKTRRRPGSIKKKVKTRKKDYVTLTRKLRSHLLYLKKTKQITPENFKEIRKEIRTKIFRSLAHMKERIASNEKVKIKTKAKKKRKKK
jgi:large subunit ribosomal protein L19e